MFKKLICICLACFCVAALSISSTKLPNSSSRYRDFLADLYQGKMDFYTIIDLNGNKITEQFYSETVSYAQSGNWAAIEQYCFKNLSSLCKTHTYETTEQSFEQKKTEIQDWITYVDGISGSNYQNFHSQVDFELKGTIWYNSNTGTITNAEARIGRTILQTGCQITRRHSKATISEDSKSAKIECSISTAYYLMYDELQIINPIKFEPAKHSFVMQV